MINIFLFQFRRINSEEALQHFAQKFLESEQKYNSNPVERRGASIPLDYLKNAQVFGVFDAGNRMLAGYIINTKHPFRLLDFVPLESRSTILAQNKQILENGCELTCAWRLPELSSIFMSIRFWPHALCHTVKTRKHFFIGGSSKKGLDKFYTQVGPSILYMGPTIIPGLAARIFYYSRWGLVGCAFTILAVETPKRIVKKWINKTKSFFKMMSHL
jgi:hypothetical protein